MAQYDKRVIHEYAERLYAQAKSSPALYFFVGILGGILVFGEVGMMLMGSYDPIIIAIGVMTGAILGINAGRDRAMYLKLQAQLALCQAKIEENSAK